MQTPALSSTTVACTSRKSTFTSVVSAQIIQALQMALIAARHVQSTDLSFYFCLDASHASAALTSATGVNTDMTVPMTHAHAPSKRAESRSLRSVSLLWQECHSFCSINIKSFFVCFFNYIVPLRTVVAKCNTPNSRHMTNKNCSSLPSVPLLKAGEIKRGEMFGYVPLIAVIFGSVCKRSSVKRTDTPFN